MKKGIIALICMIITLVFIVVALIGPWYAISSKSSGFGMDYDSDASITLTSTTTSNGKTETTSHADAKKDASNKDVFSVFDNTLYITIVALIMAILAFIGMLGLMFNFGNLKTMKMLGSIFSIITLIIVFIAVFYFMTAFPAEAEMKTIDGDDAGFWYSESKSEQGVEASISYGPGYAWYLMLIGGILALVSAIILFMDKPGPTMAPAPPQQPM